MLTKIKRGIKKKYISMKNDLYIKNGIVIPGHEIEITASRAGGPGGQHVNKASTRITVRWNVLTTSALDTAQKERVVKKLGQRLTAEGDLIIHSSASRSQKQNKDEALKRLAHEVRQALAKPKKRIETKIPKAAEEKRIQQKKKRGQTKKMRKAKFNDF